MQELKENKICKSRKCKTLLWIHWLFKPSCLNWWISPTDLFYDPNQLVRAPGTISLHLNPLDPCCFTNSLLYRLGYTMTVYFTITTNRPSSYQLQKLMETCQTKQVKALEHSQGPHQDYCMALCQTQATPGWAVITRLFSFLPSLLANRRSSL